MIVQRDVLSKDPEFPPILSYCILFNVNFSIFRLNLCLNGEDDTSWQFITVMNIFLLWNWNGSKFEMKSANNFICDNSSSSSQIFSNLKFSTFNCSAVQASNAIGFDHSNLLSRIFFYGCSVVNFNINVNCNFINVNFETRREASQLCTRVKIFPIYILYNKICV